MLGAMMQPTQSDLASHGRLINIDNGGTLTDVVVIDGDRVHRTKTLTTPHDLSKCLFEGLRKVSRAIFGKEDLQALLLSTESIRYSTTQGTNALIERQGPRLGLLLGGLPVERVRGVEGAAALYDAIVAERALVLGSSLDGGALEDSATRAVNALSERGASRIVVALAGPSGAELEQRLQRHLLRAFPPHLLGALPILYARQVAEDQDDVRRTWTALFNAFLHPPMERLLYAAEHKLRDQHVQSPLLVFRNDGYAGRVAKTTAVKTYSSGPRGGMEGVRALAAHYALPRLVSMDIGGTTTDLGVVERGAVRITSHGRIEGVETSFPLCDVISVGVGGSSIMRVEDGKILVGPQSVGSAPGPACFALGGTQATITDALLAAGLLDPASYFGGDLQLDLSRARAALKTRVAAPLHIEEDAAIEAMTQAWVDKIAESLKTLIGITSDTTLAAFGGAGPFIACRIAEAVGVTRVLVPGLAAVFSAYGVGFSDVGHEFSAALPARDDTALAAVLAELRTRAERVMFGEGVGPDGFRTELRIEVHEGATVRSISLASDRLPTGLPAEARITVALTAVKPVPHAVLSGRFGAGQTPAVARGTREVLIRGERRPLPLYRVEEQPALAYAVGPAVIEEAFFTGLLDAGWTFERNAAGDMLFEKQTGGAR